MIAYAVHETGIREVLGIDVGEAETEAFWTEFLFSLKARGLGGVRLCVSDAHQGLRAAIARVLGCRWQRCTVHFLRDMLGHCSRQLATDDRNRDPPDLPKLTMAAKHASGSPRSSIGFNTPAPKVAPPA